MRLNLSLRNLRLTGLLLALLAGILVTSACNTWHGAGRDMERTGEKMQHN